MHHTGQPLQEAGYFIPSPLRKVSSPQQDRDGVGGGVTGSPAARKQLEDGPAGPGHMEPALRLRVGIYTNHRAAIKIPSRMPRLSSVTG